MQIHTVATPELGDRSYVVTTGESALVIDPQRDLDRIEATLDVAPAYVLETHVHNDYLTGGLTLATRTGAGYGVNAQDEVAFARVPLSHGQILSAGSLRVQVLATPGHTDTHLAYVVTDDDAPEQPAAVFSGGSLLYGTVGRTDLVDPSRARALAAEQYRSALLLGSLDPATLLFPTHGFGSFCSSTTGSRAELSTVGEQVEKNVAFLARDERSFVDSLVAGFGAYPSYYAHMAPLNRLGPGAVALDAPVPGVAPEALVARIQAGEVVVDLRDRIAYAASHLAGTLSINLGQQFATYLGWLAPFATPVTLVGASRSELEDARRQLVRIGFEDVDGIAGPLPALAPPWHPRRSYPLGTFAQVAAGLGPDDAVLDVRRDEERAQFAVRDSWHVPLHELPARLGSLPAKRWWVHCVSGFRAGTAASMLENAGFDVVHIDDHIDRAVELGLTA